MSRGDFDALDRAETRSVARSYNETIIRPVTRCAWMDNSDEQITIGMLQEAAECSGHLVQEQWVHEDWESGGASIKVLPKTFKKETTKIIYKSCFSQDGRNAEKDGGSSFVVSPQQQLYRLHVSSISDACLYFFVNDLMSFPRQLLNNHHPLFQDSDGSFESL